MKSNSTGESRPAWLVRMENGSIGEARTRAFLIDRFWILERSVDVDGADFFIQRRITGRNLLDKEPPMLGVVQAKFFHSEATTQYLHKEYIVTFDDVPRNEFFLMCHTGSENKARSYLLSASDIVKNFPLTNSDHSKPNCYKIPGSELLNSTKYEVVSSELCLDRIERALDTADFMRNRRFLSWALPGMGKVVNKIEPLYEEPLYNWYADIPEEFVKMKKRVQSAIFNLEDVLEPLNEILETDDPEKALSIAEDINHLHKGYVSIPDDIFDEDLLTAVKEHKERCTQLGNHGLLDLYLKMQNECISFICSDLAPKMVLDRDEAYIVKIVYDEKSFSTWTFSSETKSVSCLFSNKNDTNRGGWSGEDRGRGILSSRAGEIVGFFLAGRYSYKKFENGEYVDEIDKNWEEKLESGAICVTQDIMYKIYEEKFGEL